MINKMINIIGQKSTPGWFEIIFVVSICLLTVIIPRLLHLVNIPWNFIYTIFWKYGVEGADKGAFYKSQFSFFLWPLLVTYIIGYGMRLSCYFIAHKQYIIIAYIYIFLILMSLVVVVGIQYWEAKNQYIYMTM